MRCRSPTPFPPAEVSGISLVGSFRRATQRAVRRRKQPTLTVLHSSARSDLQALSRTSDAAQPCIVYCTYMHERIPSPGKVSDWLLLQQRRTSRTTLISAITVLDSQGTHGFKLVMLQPPKFAHDTHNLTSALPLRKLPNNAMTTGELAHATSFAAHPCELHACIRCHGLAGQGQGALKTIGLVCLL